jgi:hypothetical protein
MSHTTKTSMSSIHKVPNVSAEYEQAKPKPTPTAIKAGIGNINYLEDLD